MQKQINIGLFGLGNIGAGVAGHIQKVGKQYNLKLKTVVVSDIKKHRSITGVSISIDPKTILNNPEIDLVIELIGGIEPARSIIEKALQNNKSVITANKAVIARHAKELFSLAQKHNVDLAFEASVAGGIPIVQIFRRMRGEQINKVMGIVNGTTNYILTKMSEGLNFEKALHEAQKNGFAEKNHILDTGGFDARDKLSILAMLLYNAHILPEQIHCDGITNITSIDLDFANRYGEFEGNVSYTIKLLAIAEKVNNILYLRVHPTLIRKTHQLASVANEFNAIYFEGELAGSQLHTGKGAGRNATTSAVIADVLRVANNIRRGTPGLLPTLDTKITLGNSCDLVKPGYLRMDLLNEPGSAAEMFGILAKHKLNVENMIQNHKYSYHVLGKEFSPVITNIDQACENTIKAAIKDLQKSKRVRGKPVFIRFEE